MLGLRPDLFQPTRQRRNETLTGGSVEYQRVPTAQPVRCPVIGVEGPGFKPARPRGLFGTLARLRVAEATRSHFSKGALVPTCMGIGSRRP